MKDAMIFWLGIIVILSGPIGAIAIVFFFLRWVNRNFHKCVAPENPREHFLSMGMLVLWPGLIAGYCSAVMKGVPRVLDFLARLL